MSQTVEKPVVAIIDSKSLRRASLTSFLEPWANSKDLRLTSFNLDQAREALPAETNLEMVILNVGGESIAEQENLRHLKVLRGLATSAPFVVISDREDAQEIAAALSAETKGFIHSAMDAELAREALSFILHGGSYFPPSAVRQLQTQLGQAAEPEQADNSEGDGGHETNGLTAREQEVLKRVCLGESNKMIARQLGMMEPTVKVYVGQLMRKFHAANRTQLTSLSLASEDRSAADKTDNNVSTERSVKQSSGTSFATAPAEHRERGLRLITPPRGRRVNRW